MLRGATSRTINDLVRHRSISQPDDIAYRFLSDDGAAYREISYRSLEESSRRISAWVGSRGRSGQPIPLIFAPGLDFISAFYGCLRGGAIAVPLSLPSFSGGAGRVSAALADIRPSVILVGGSEAGRVRRELTRGKVGLAFDIVSFPEALESEHQGREPDLDPDVLAFLQYTSGSTASPKGVEISHRNLLHNVGLIAVASQVDERSVGVSWLPHFHDMGLIGGILMPLYAGFPVTLMSPASFLRRPVRWLEAISRFAATISGAPNFGYEHCQRELAGDALRSIDLSSWRTAYTGAEPIRVETVESFCAAFGRVGFRKEAMFPCYGLAEATLMVSGQSWSDRSAQRFDRSSLEIGRVAEPSRDQEGVDLIGAGPVLDGHRVVIVDPASRMICPDGAVGEIWLHSESVGRGYWNRPDESLTVFRARPLGMDKEFLRTGDLGFVWHEQLFVTGRHKDLLIIRGANFHPYDIEHVLEAAVPWLRAGFGAVFSVEEEREERLVVAYELDDAGRRPSEADFEAVVGILSREFGLQPHAIVLVRRNRIPRTTSGKIRRQQCRAEFLAGQLAMVAEWRFRTSPVRSEADSLEIRLTDAADVEQAVRHVFKAHLAELLGMPADHIDEDRSIYDLGIDSLMASRLQNRIEDSLGIRLELARVLEAGTVGCMVQQVAAQVESGARRRSAAIIDEMFERVASLSDDEVSRLLALDEHQEAGERRE
ncbi:AMP-binding protein [Bradyrhizobium sp. SZCCHNPS2010]|uniref:AMP-binding protein n=1 Tax=Bradyrhizobium sp. SZCCHNPS2010 TaxID=3057333 RepID=UPI002916E960|nr:AMP-binding protein [Bradyrhizobium sp. SZCCHNPS2010]